MNKLNYESITISFLWKFETVLIVSLVTLKKDTELERQKKTVCKCLSTKL